MKLVSARRLAVLTALLGFAPGIASAHMGFSRFDMVEGALNPVLSMYTLLPLIAMGVVIAFQKSLRLQMLILLVISALIGGVGYQWGLRPPQMQTVLLTAIILFGLMAAAKLRLPLWLMLPMIAIAGFAAGQVNLALETGKLREPELFAIGVALGSGAFAGYFTAVIAARRFQWFQLAGRVLGSWIAAAGLMVGVLQFHGS